MYATVAFHEMYMIDQVFFNPKIIKYVKSS